MSIDSDQINFLIYRYLIESGFQHSSFTFAQESGVTRSSVTSNKIPPGALIAHLQRALNYVQAEVNLTEDGRPADLEDLEAVEALNLIEACQPEVCEQRRKQLTEHLKEQGKYNTHAPPKQPAVSVSDTTVPADDVLLLKVVKFSCCVFVFGMKKLPIATFCSHSLELVVLGARESSFYMCLESKGDAARFRLERLHGSHLGHDYT
eukprot:m.31186 g.31186  ORF g.31186 m.31186 type:complete len:206 (-) comp12043_c0_seq2:901-1518(-)